MTTEQMDAMDDYRNRPSLNSQAGENHLRALPAEARGVNTYTSQPVEAILIHEKNLDMVARWCGGRVIPPGQHSSPGGVRAPHLDKPVEVMEGDYLLRTTTGAYARMAAQEFRNTYSRALHSGGHHFHGPDYLAR